MDVVLMVCEILFIADAMVGESSLPDFPPAAEVRAKSVRISTFHELHGVFQRDVGRRSEQEMNMFRHSDKGIDLEAAFAAVAVDGLQEEANIALYYQEPSTLPGRKRHEICSGWGDESSRFQEGTSAAEAAIFVLG